MTTQRDALGRSARTVSDAGAFVEHTARATASSHSMMGRAIAAVSAIRLGARLAPAGWRLMRRYPVAATLGIVGLMFALYLTRQDRRQPL